MRRNMRNDITMRMRLMNGSIFGAMNGTLKGLFGGLLKVMGWGILIPAILVGCSFNDDLIDCDSSESNYSDGDIVAYISVNFSAPNSNSTRANPTGGEWGDGREYGQNYEDSVYSAVLFVYQADDGVNGPDTTNVKYVEYDKDDIYSGEIFNFNNIDYIAKSVAKPLRIDAGNYNVLAVANPSSDFLSTIKGKGNSLTLGDVRDYIETSAWTESGKSKPYSYSSFVMASENDNSTVFIDGYNNEDNPAKVTVDLERMAARVDYRAPSELTIKEDTTEDIEGDDAFMGATVHITGAAIVNNLTAGSYILKRVNDGYGTSVTYLGDEITTDASDVADNYVIDPWTEYKNGATTVTINGVSSSIDKLYGTYYNGVPTGDQVNPSYWNELVTSDNIVAVTDNDGTVWNRIGYTMENTTYSDYTSRQYATGVIFKAYFKAEDFIHDSFYSDYGYSYTDSTTFFMWNNNLYATPEDMMAAAYPGKFTLGDTEYGDRFEGKINSCTTWAEIVTFANTLSEDDPTGYKKYLLEQASGKSGSLSDTYKSTLTWDYYMGEEIGYKIDWQGTVVTGVVINDFNSGASYSSTRAALAAATDDAVSTYEDAQCYYTWWIRHSNDDNDNTNGTMEFAIVRNNIYKLDVASVFSLGGDVPTVGMHVVVTVKTWLLYDTDVIDL